MTPDAPLGWAPSKPLKPNTLLLFTVAKRYLATGWDFPLLGQALAMSKDLSVAGLRFRTLDAMRGVAALLVALYHFQERQNLDFVGGYLAVDLFFALSGFVIALNYTLRLSEGLSLARFLRLRLVRLYPVYALGHCLGIARQLVAHVLHDPRAMDWTLLLPAVGLGAMMLPSPVHTSLFPLNGPAWSLFFEMAINIVFAVVLWRVRSVAILGLMAIAACVMILTIGPPYYFNSGWAWDSFIQGAARTTFSFSSGILLYRHIPLKVGTGSWGVLIPLALMSMLIGFNVSGPNQKAFELIAVLCLFPSLIALGLLAEPPRQLQKLFTFLGDISYPIYAIHWPILPLVVPLILKLKFGFWPSAGIYLGMIIVLGYLVLRFVDAPLHSRLRRKLEQPTLGKLVTALMPEGRDVPKRSHGTQGIEEHREFI